MDACLETTLSVYPFQHEKITSRQSPEEWRASRVTFLQRAVQYAGAGEARERASLMVPHEQRSPARSQRSPARAPQRASPAAVPSRRAENVANTPAVLVHHWATDLWALPLTRGLWLWPLFHLRS